MSRSELSAQASAELAALDAILAGEPVSDEHLELAALVESVNRTSPTLDEAGHARLDARVAKLRAPRTRQAGRPRPARIALAGGPLLAIALAAVAIIASGVLNGSKPTPRVIQPFTTAPGIVSNALGTGSVRSEHKAASGGAAIGATGATAAAPFAASTPPSANATVTRGTAPIPGANLNPRNRLVARGASLTLASTPDQMQAVANEVVSNTERLGGIVESSSVNVHGMSSYASFSLSVPAPRLGQLISSLSSLTAVRALDQSTSDITDSYDQASAQLADEKAQRAALIKALAAAYTLTQEQTIQQKIGRLDSEIAAATRHVGALLTRGHNAKVAVQIVPAAAGAVGGGGPVNRALNDALTVLDVALAIALVALALVLPVALVALALFWATSSVRQRSRERALAATAAS
jgi:hypothetical protein